MVGTTDLEQLRAERFMDFLLRGQEVTLVCKPDASGLPGRPGKRPDYVFQDGSGQRYVLELTRLLTKELLRLENFLQKYVCAPLENSLSGTYTLSVPFERLRNGVISQADAQKTEAEIQGLIQTGRLTDKQSLSTGLELVKVLDTGNGLVPWITSPDLPPDLKVDDPRATRIRQWFEDKCMKEADTKFLGYRGHRILLLDISQSGLEWELHAQKFKDSQGALLSWIEQLSPQPVNIDAIWIDSQPSVWEATSPMRRVLSGHRYTDASIGYYVRLWQQPSVSNG